MQSIEIHQLHQNPFVTKTLLLCLWLSHVMKCCAFAGVFASLRRTKQQAPLSTTLSSSEVALYSLHQLPGGHSTAFTAQHGTAGTEPAPCQPPTASHKPPGPAAHSSPTSSHSPTAPVSQADMETHILPWSALDPAPPLLDAFQQQNPHIGSLTLASLAGLQAHIDARFDVLEGRIGARMDMLVSQLDSLLQKLSV